MVRLYELQKGHDLVFFHGKPQSMYFLMSLICDYYNTHPLRPEFTSLYQYTTDKRKKFIRDIFVSDVEITNDLEGVAPAFHFKPGVHRSWRIIEYLKRDKQILVPLVVINDNGQLTVYEGHHRAGAAKLLGWKTIPAIVLNADGKAPGYGNMSNDNRLMFRDILLNRGLPDTSRIHGMKIHTWSEKELRQFMVPRPGAQGKYNARSQVISDCVDEEDARWKDVPRGIIIRIREGDFILPWEIESEF